MRPPPTSKSPTVAVVDALDVAVGAELGADVVVGAAAVLCSCSEGEPTGGAPAGEHEAVSKATTATPIAATFTGSALRLPDARIGSLWRVHQPLGRARQDA